MRKTGPDCKVETATCRRMKKKLVLGNKVKICQAPDIVHKLKNAPLMS
jgi:hypothetical protein